VPHSWYDPTDGKIHLAPDACLYVRFHELAHKEQYEQRALCSRVWGRACRIRFARYFACLWIEFDAHRRARAVMKVLGLWNDEASRTAWGSLVSYLLKRDPR
jgi:predicted PhzF superfamily epimerase YddE/YHI9